MARVVEGNANVRTAQIEMNGEDVMAWEWTGAAGLLTEDLDSVDEGTDAAKTNKAPLYPSLDNFRSSPIVM